MDPAIGGAQYVVADGGVPRSFTARARTTISGGQFVVSSGAAGAIGSVSSLFNPGSIVVDLIHDGDFANGIALKNVGSNGLVTVIQDGIWAATAGGVCSGGMACYVASGTVQYVVGQPITAYSGGQIQVAKCIIPADSGTTHYGLFSFNFS